MLKIGITGPESTGKSTIATQLAERLDGCVVEEYARTYLQERSSYLPADLSIIAHEQLRQINVANCTNDVFIDTDITVIKIWSEVKFGTCPPEILDMQKNQEIDFFLLMYPDLAWEPDPQRESQGKLMALFERYQLELDRQGELYQIVKGSGEQRYQNAIRAIKLMRKSSNDSK